MRLARVERGQRVTAPDHVYAALRDAIVFATVEPGQQLSENELARMTGVSRTPVREALVRLRDDALIEIVPQLGTFVARINPRAVADAQFVRESLECAAIRVVALRANANDVRVLRGIVRSQRKALAANALDLFYELDDALHQSFCELSEHRIAWSLSQRAAAHLNRIRHLSIANAGYVAKMVDQHKAVIDAIARADPDASERLLRDHLRAVLSGIPQLLESRAEYFEPHGSAVRLADFFPGH